MSRGAGAKKSASPRQQSTKDFIKSALGSTEREPGWEYGQVLPVRARKNEEGEMEREWGLGYSNTAKGMLDAITLPRKAFEGEEVSPEQAMEMAMNITAPGVATARYAPGVLNMPMVYHGTPHRFAPTPDNPLGEFDASKIGTGEGAQAYGHGIYLAESSDTAEGYAKTLANRDMANQGRLNAHANAQRLAALAGDPEYAADDIRFLLSNEPDHPQKTLLQGTLAFLESGDFAKPLETKGNLYTADLPDEMVDKMLDWDKPFLDQSQEIKDLAKNLLPSAVYNQLLTQRSGDFVEELAKYKGGKAKASELMRQAGIPGIRYLDQGSRDKGKGTRNFVLFPGDEKKAKILKRD